MNATARLYVVRHGRTGGNKQRYLGWEDEALDGTGRAQASAVAAALDDEPIDRVYASPLVRARDTAAPLAAANSIAIEIRNELKEVDYGRYQGLLKAEQPLKLRREHLVAPLPGGESLYDVYRRVSGMAGELRKSLEAGAKLAVVGHFWSNRMLVGVMQGIPFDLLFEQSRYKPANGSIYEIAFGRSGDGLVVAAQGWRLQGGDGVPGVGHAPLSRNQPA